MNNNEQENSFNAISYDNNQNNNHDHIQQMMMQNEQQDNKPKKKTNIIFFFLKLLLIFVVYEQLNPFIYGTIGRAIIYGRYSQEIILEAVCFAIIMVILLLAGNKYIFYEKKKKFLQSIGVGGAMFGFAVLVFLTNIPALFASNGNDILSLIIFCLFIGLFEEFMCRGWIQNELIERYSKSREQAYLSIVLSSLIFGGMHISNIWIGGQGVIETLSQVIQATGMGIYLGAIYYRTKNIWGNVFLHGFWDFAIMLGEINVIKTCSEGVASKEYIISQLIVATIFLCIYSLLGLFVMRKSKINDQFTYTEEEIKTSEKRKGRIIFAVILLYISISYFGKENENSVCYEYDEKDVVVTERVRPLYDEYYFEDNNVRLKLYLDEETIKIKDLDSQYEKSLDIDYAQKFIVVKDKDRYHVLVVGLNQYQMDTVLYYSTFLTTPSMTNEEYYIDKFTNSFIEIDSAPSIKELGYFYSYLDDTTYPFIKSTKNEDLLISDNKLYTFAMKDHEKFIEDRESFEQEESEEVDEETIDESENLEEITDEEIADTEE